MRSLHFKLTLLGLVLGCSLVSYGQDRGRESSQAVKQTKEKAVSSKKAPTTSISAADAFEKLRKEMSEKVEAVYKTSAFHIDTIQTTIKSGDKASGVVIDEPGETITLDVTPCEEKKTLVTFHKKYKSESVSSVKCGEKEYDRAQITQQ